MPIFSKVSAESLPVIIRDLQVSVKRLIAAKTEEHPNLPDWVLSSSTQNLLVQVLLQLLGVLRPAKLGEGLGLNMADALHAHAKLVAYANTNMQARA
jgi:hypothetical protein